TIQRGKPPEWWEKQKGSRGIRRGQWYRLVFQFPIREQRVIGCLNLVYMASAMTIEQAAEKHLPALQRVAKQIEEGVESQAILVAGRRSGMHLR
ncbi:hypothetical protein ACJHW6_24110, partial [Escherichia sp. WS539]